jgi:hypothetical protein
MTEALPEPRPRRRRYTSAANAAIPSLTPVKRRLLDAVGTFGFASLPQLARLMELSEKATRKHMRPLFDAGLVEIIAVHRAALAHDTANDAQLLGGSAPNIFRLSRSGAKLLAQLGWEAHTRIASDYGPRNSLFLAHELVVRDARIWLELTARQESTHELLRFEMGEAAWIDLKKESTPALVRPDAWFVYRLDGAVLVGLLEVDQGTERGTKSWTAKVTAYQQLFHSDRLKAVTGYQHARVLVVTPTAARRDHLAAFLSTHANPDLARRFWLADQAALSQLSLGAAVWRQPGSQLLRPLIAANPLRMSREGASS